MSHFGGGKGVAEMVDAYREVLERRILVIIAREDDRALEKVSSWSSGGNCGDGRGLKWIGGSVLLRWRRGG